MDTEMLTANVLTIYQLRLENSVLRRELFVRTGKTLGDLLRDGA